MGGLNLLEFVCTINLVNNIPQSFACITRENVSISEWFAALWEVDSESSGDGIS